MRYRRFGKTNLEMPRFSCGSMRFMQSWTDIPLDKVPRENQENLERTVKAALDAGINHLETARGYGSSEAQLGVALKHLPRRKIILQTKVAPQETPEQFEHLLETSFQKLDVERVELLALHGVDKIHFPILPHCLEVAEKWKREGRVGHIGFSTHASTESIIRTIQLDRFEFVNLHYYYIFQDNRPAIDLARANNMGVFIISPNDKGGMLSSPPEKLSRLTAPLSPMEFNDLFCLSTPGVTTLSVGAAKPSDFKQHADSLEYLPATGINPLIAEIAERLDNAQRETVGNDWMNANASNLPVWHETPGRINIPVILQLWRLAKSFDLLEYAKMRYSLLGHGGIWFPGNKAKILLDHTDGPAVAKKIIELCSEQQPAFAQKIPDILRDAHITLSPE